VIILAGPNGAGKSTLAASLLQGAFRVDEFVNADVIAQTLAPDDIDSAAIAAGRVMLNRIHELARKRVSFAFETTLASRSFAPWLATLRREGYSIHLLFLWLPSLNLRLTAWRTVFEGVVIPCRPALFAVGIAPAYAISSICTSPWRRRGGYMTVLPTRES